MIPSQKKQVEEMAKELYNVLPAQIWDKEKQRFRKEEFEELDSEVQEVIRTVAKHVLGLIIQAKIDGMESVPELKVNLIAYQEAKYQLKYLNPQSGIINDPKRNN